MDSIYGAGCTDRPEVCFVFMNPTARNVSSHKEWQGMKAPWIGIKHTWKLFNSVGVFSSSTLGEVLSKNPDEWSYAFAEKVYKELAANKVYVTNLGKCTKTDATHISDGVFREYLGLLEREIDGLRPKKIITFGNQVSSLFIGRPIKVSEFRKQCCEKTVEGRAYRVFPVYYPVGQGMRNLPRAIEDIRFALSS